MKPPSIFSKFIPTTVVFAVVLACATTTAMAEQQSAQSANRLGFQSIVGSWKLVDDQSGDIFFGTYNGGPLQGTVNFSSPDNSIGLTHGAWKRTGRRTFADTDSGFIYGDDGMANLIITFRAEIKVNRDGETAAFDFEFEVRDFDGAVVNSGASTGTATRIEVEPLSSN